jgi:hypothetical protein
MRRAQQHTITFAVFDSTTGARKTGVGFNAGELQWSKDGANFVNVSGTPAELLLSDASPSGVYRLLLSASESSTGWGHLVGNRATCKPIDVSGPLGEQLVYAVVDHADNSASSFVTDLPTDSDNARRGGYVRFQTGALAQQVRKVATHAGATKVLTFERAFTAEPAAGDLFAFVND